MKVLYSHRLADARTALINAPRTPLASSSDNPAMVVPAGEATLSFNRAGWDMEPSPAASKTWKQDPDCSSLDASERTDLK